MNVEGLDPHWVWLIGAAVLGIAEMLVPGVFLIWLAAAAAVTGFATLFFDLSLAFQFGVFAVTSLIAVYAGRRWYTNNPVASSDPQLNDRVSRLIGEIVVVVSAIENGIGRVKVGDSVWNARGPDTQVGASVRVIGADGTYLKVEPVA